MLPFMLLHDALGVLGNCDVLCCLLGHHSIELKMLRERSLTIGGGGLVNFGGGLCFFGRPFGVGHNFMGPRFIGEGYNFWAPFIKTLGDVHKWVLCY